MPLPRIGTVKQNISRPQTLLQEANASMNAPLTTRRFLNELSDGDNVDEIYLLTDKQLRANRNANLYLLASLRDKTGVVNGLMWNVTEESVSEFDAGACSSFWAKTPVLSSRRSAVVVRLILIERFLV